jgi:hypothetical protein
MRVRIFIQKEVRMVVPKWNSRKLEPSIPATPHPGNKTHHP